VKDQRFRDIESVYEVARQWAARRTRSTDSRYRSKFKYIEEPKPLPLFQSPPAGTTEIIQGISDDNLDVELAKVTCYNCGRKGHSFRNCKVALTVKVREESDSDSDFDSESKDINMTMALYSLTGNEDATTSSESVFH
jgi:Zinc knuckle